MNTPGVNHSGLQSNYHSFNQFKWKKVLIVPFREKKRKSRELSEEAKKKIVAKHGQSQDYKLSTMPNVHAQPCPMSTMPNVIKKFPLYCSQPIRKRTQEKG